MQVSEQNLPFTQRRRFLWLRFFDFDDQFGSREHLRPARQDAGPDRLVGRILETDTGSRAGLDHHFVTMMHDLPNTAGREADTVFMGLHLLRDTDQHGKLHSTGIATGRVNTGFRFRLLPRHSVAFG